MNTKQRIIKVLEMALDKTISLEGQKNLNDFNINSLSFIKIIVGIEEEFDLTFDDDTINFDLFGNIDDIVQLVEETQNVLKNTSAEES